MLCKFEEKNTKSCLRTFRQSGTKNELRSIILQHYREADNYKLCIFYSELRIGGRETEIHHENCLTSLACSSLKTGEKKIDFAIVFSPLSVSFVAPKKVTRCVCVAGDESGRQLFLSLYFPLLHSPNAHSTVTRILLLKLNLITKAIQ